MMDLQRTGPAPRSELNELLDCVRCNLPASQMSQRCSFGLRLGMHEGQSVVSVLFQEMPAYSRHMGQKQPRSHCTSVGCDSSSEDLMPIPSGSQVAWPAEVCVSLYGYASLNYRHKTLNDVSGSTTFSMASPDLLSSMKRTGCQR